jgi:uncharacterized protein YkwD
VPTVGVSAFLNQGALTVTGTSPSAPIAVDVFAVPVSGWIVGYVVVEGVGLYPASQVQKVAINKPAAEPLRVVPGPMWNPSFAVNTTPPTPPAPGPSFIETAAEQDIVNAVNLVREQNGLAPLSVNPKLVEAAQIHANDMGRLADMAHDLPGAAQPTLLDRASFVGYRFTTLGENIAFNYPDTASVMSAWLSSPGHRANILDPNYTEIGVGIGYDSSGQPYYCQDFGHPA